MAFVFSWDPQKESGNRKKHGVSFKDAVSAFSDPLSVIISDPLHSGIESRYLLIGLTLPGRLLVVAHVERGDNIRIINARLATRRERLVYEEGT
jgi:uncharacterized DUF497 family protein